MFRILLSLLFVLSIGSAEGKKDRSVVKTKVIMIPSDDEQESKDINVEADVDGETLRLVITVNGNKKEFEVPLGNEEAMEALAKELEEMDLNVNIAQFMEHGNGDDDEEHGFMRMMRWHGQEKRGILRGINAKGSRAQSR